MASKINGFSLKEVCVRSTYWAMLSMALFALTLPVGLYQLNITGATPFLILTVQKAVFTAVLTTAVVGITYYGTLTSSHPHDTWKVIKKSIFRSGALEKTILGVGLFMAFLAAIGSFWINGIDTLVSLAAALMAIVFTVRKITVRAIQEDIVNEDDLARYSRITNAELNNTKVERRFLTFRRVDNVERTPFMVLSTVLVVVGLAYIVQIVTQSLEMSKSATDIVNLLVYYPCIIIWIQARAIFRRWSVERYLAKKNIKVSGRDVTS